MSRRLLSLRGAIRQFSQETTNTPTPKTTTFTPKTPTTAPIVQAKGLSDAVVQPASGSVGPEVAVDKSSAYKVPEYFCYHTMSYYEAEIEMSRYRLPQPSSLK